MHEALAARSATGFASVRRTPDLGIAAPPRSPERIVDGNHREDPGGVVAFPLVVLGFTRESKTSPDVVPFALNGG